MKLDQLYMIVMVGAPGSGKSTWAEHFAKTNEKVVLLCPDKARAIFGTGESDQTVSAVAFEYVHTKAQLALQNNINVIIDATNMYKKARKRWTDLADMFEAKKIAVVFERDKNELLKRNQERGNKGGRNVPEHVIDSMLEKYQQPTNDEFDKIEYL